MNARERAMLAHPAGKGIRESDEVAQHRMDTEAVNLANSGRPEHRWLDIAVPAGVTVALFAFAFWVTILADIGRWIG